VKVFFRPGAVPQGPNPSIWRKIQVEISATQFRLDWEGQHWEIPRQDIVKRTQHYTNLIHDRVAGNTWLNLRYGLGLFVKQAEVSFRNVVVAPLP
jgi:hypothetical protein